MIMPPIASYFRKIFCFESKPKHTNMAPVVLILGSGPRVGASVAQAFKNKGYGVAIASRTGIDSKTDHGYFSIRVDFASPPSVAEVFSCVKAEFGSGPSVVIYNAASLTPPPDPSSVLSIPVEAVTKDLNINVVSPYVAAQEALAAWEALPQDTKKTFIYTGNALNERIIAIPAMMNLGAGKAASAHWVGLADTLYQAKGYR